REPYSSDIARPVYSLQGQSVAWHGLRAISQVWAEAGFTQQATRARLLARRLERGLRRAVRVSARRLPDGSLFVPAALLGHADPFERVTASRNGSYWNLVAPYALASGLFAPHSPAAEGLMRYLLGHGSRFLGLVRSQSRRLTRSGRPAAATDEVYGSNVARF